MMDMYENISVYKCFDIEDEFVLHLNPPEAILAGAVTKKAQFIPRPFEGKIIERSVEKQTIANSRESTEAAKNKMESTPRTL